MDKPSVPLRPFKHELMSALALCGLGLLLSVSTYIFVQYFETIETSDAFQGVAQQRLRSLQDNIVGSQLPLTALAAFYGLAPPSAQADFSQVASHLLSEHNALYAIGWVPQVTQVVSGGVESLNQGETPPSFPLLEKNPDGHETAAGSQNPHFPLRFIEPLLVEDWAIGTNIATDPVYREALDRAAQTGKAAITSRIIHHVDHKNEFGAIIFVPVYKNGASSGELTGYVFGALCIDDVVELTRAPSTENTGIEIALFDSEAKNAAHRLYPIHSTIDDIADIHHDFQVINQIDVMGREWQVVAYPSAGMFSVVRWTGGFAAVAVFLLSLVAGFYIRSAFLHRASMKYAVQVKTRELQESLDQLKQAKEQADVGNKAKTDFLAKMSHEIRTPLNGVIATAELFAQMDLNEKQRKYINIMRSSGEMLLVVINDILDLSKIDAGKVELQPKPLDIRHEAELVESVYAAQAEVKYLKLGVRVDESMPRRIVADPHRLRQIVSNLISNAIKYTKQGSVNATFSLVGNAGSHKVRFSVIDTGSGIPLESQKLIFEKFTQISRDKAINGTGLGLPICQTLVELMGGEIGVISDGVNGSEFWFEIPYVAADPDEATMDPRMSVVMVRVNHAGCRVLLAEDIEINRIVATEMLRELGCVVDAAENGQEALKAIGQNQYDIVLMDCQMPIMNGYDATKALRNKGYTQPIIALTAHTFPEEVQKCIAAGMNDFVSKPIKHDLLARILDKWHTNTPDAMPRPSAPSAVKPQEGSEPPDAFDAEALHTLFDTMPDKIDFLVELTIKDGDRLYADVAKAVEENNASDLDESAHSLKSVVRQAGGIGLAKVCQEMEMMGKGGQIEGAVALFERMTPLYRSFIDQIHATSMNYKERHAPQK